MMKILHIEASPSGERSGSSQPPINPAKPHMRGYPENLYKAIIGTPDEVITAQASEADPPVVVED